MISADYDPDLVYLPAGYVLHALSSDDLEAVAEVLIADELNDSGQSTLGAEFVRRRWSRPGFDLVTDAWAVVDRSETIVGYGQVLREEATVVESLGVVHPRHRGRGIGSALFGLIEQRASKMLAGLPAVRFRHAVHARDAGAAAILRARGLRLVRHFWHMQIDLAGPVEPEPAPDGIAIRTVETADDLAAVHRILNEAFADHWGHHPEAFEAWSEEQTTSPSYDPTLWLLALDGKTPAGFLTASVGEDRGWVDYLGILTPYRKRGIGASLLRRSFALFSGRGQRRVTLSVDAENATGATALYEREGMHVVKAWDMWERSWADSA